MILEEVARRPTDCGRELFHVRGYRLHARGDDPLGPVRSRLGHLQQAGRADIENRPKERKGAFEADGFCSHRF